MNQEVQTLHEPFAEFLDRLGIPFIRARSDRESTIAEGHPDFTLTCGNRCLMIEFKTKEGKLSRAQRARIAVLEAAGNLVLVIRDLGAAMAVVEHWRAGIGEIIAPKAKAADEPAERVVGGSVYRLDPALGRWVFVRLVLPRASAAPPAREP